MYPERVPNTFYEPWIGQQPQMFAIHIHRCDECNRFAVLDEYEVQIFGGSRFEPPEWDWRTYCAPCYRAIEESINLHEDLMAEAHDEYRADEYGRFEPWV